MKKSPLFVSNFSFKQKSTPKPDHFYQLQNNITFARCTPAGAIAAIRYFELYGLIVNAKSLAFLTDNSSFVSNRKPFSAIRNLNRKAPLLNFFLSKHFEVPTSFSKTSSYRRIINSSFLNKFIILLTRNGLVTRTRRIVMDSLDNFLPIIFSHLDSLAPNHEWQTLASFFCRTFVNNNQHLKSRHLLFKNILRYSYIISLGSRGIQFYASFDKANFFIENLQLMQPIFFFKFHRVDKKIKKFSRGKTGKYNTFLYYVPAFKRLAIAARLLVNEINFGDSIKLQDRLHNAFFNLFFDKDKSYAYESIQRTLAIFQRKKYKKLIRNGVVIKKM